MYNMIYNHFSLYINDLRVTTIQMLIFYVTIILLLAVMINKKYKIYYKFSGYIILYLYFYTINWFKLD